MIQQSQNNIGVLEWSLAVGKLGECEKCMHLQEKIKI